MYIPITKTEAKCAGQLSYGFNIQDKLEGCTHKKKKSLMGNLIFPFQVIKVNELLTENRLQIFQVLRENF